MNRSQSYDPPQPIQRCERVSCAPSHPSAVGDGERTTAAVLGAARQSAAPGNSDNDALPSVRDFPLPESERLTRPPLANTMPLEVQQGAREDTVPFSWDLRRFRLAGHRRLQNDQMSGPRKSSRSRCHGPAGQTTAVNGHDTKTDFRLASDSIPG
ncbi:hypothetical protein HPB47_003109 [Ixodes persulcatus]|uniref:Uncharacterized protein n=1 Tax=Ixodes persulcatus TaxID=34615 RepID=A0AC60PJI8_IXOPE|nr:hypothetical protein HPB47_003109 [Ixodes persulcatus]